MSSYQPINLNQHPDFTSDIRKGITSLYDSISEVYIKNKLREIKIVQQEHNLYILEKTDTTIGVYQVEIHSFDKDRSLNNLLTYIPFDRDQMYCELIAVFPIIEYKKMTNDEFIKNFEEIYPGNSKRNKDLINELAKNGFTSKYSISNYLNQKDNLNISSLAYVIRDLCDYLVEHNFMKSNKDENFYLSLMKAENISQDFQIPDYDKKIEYFVQKCVESKFTSKNPFEFNDGDNNVFLHKNHLIITDQNCGFYFEIKDKENISVYFLDKEYKSTIKEINRMSKSISNGTIDKIKDIVWEIKDGKTVFFNPVFMHVLDLDFKYSLIAMQDHGLGNIDYEKDVTSYQYQKDYYYTTFGLTEFQFLVQTFLTLGGGFEYDKEAGKFVDKGVKYLPNLKKEKERQTKPYTEFSYCYPTEFSNLNKDWHNGLKYLIEVLEHDRPIPFVYKGDDPNEAINKTINYLKLKLDKLEPKRKIKP